MFILPRFLYVSSTVVFLTFLSNSLYFIICKNISLESQEVYTTPKVNPHVFSVWFKNETTLSVIWEPPLHSIHLTEYRVSISPQDATNSIQFYNNTGEPIYVNFMKLIPGKAYVISAERTNKSSPILSTVVYRTIPLRPSSISIDVKFITTHSFKVSWMPPDDLTYFDKYELDVTCQLPLLVAHSITITLDKTETEYEVSEDVLPGHSYNIYLRTISGTIPSKPIAVNVTLKPLPVQNVRIIEALMVVWEVDSVSEQDAFAIKYSDEESLDNKDDETNADKKEFNLEKLLPGRKYLIQIQAISKGVKSEARSVHHITQPLPPIVEAVIPADHGLNISWKPDIDYGEELFHIVFHRNDSTDEPNLVLTNSTQVYLSHLYPGALYSIQVISVSKYAHQSESRAVIQAVMPLPPDNVTAHLTSKNALSVRWVAPVHSLISGFRIRWKTQDSERWIQATFGIEFTSQQLNLLSGEIYRIEVCSVSHSVESRSVELQWITPPDPVSDVVALLSSSAIKLKFPPPQGRVHFYNVVWSVNKTSLMSKQFPNTNNWGRFVLLSIENLIPGIVYEFKITSVSYNIESRVTLVSARTWPVVSSEIEVVDSIKSSTSLIIHYSPPPLNMLSFDSFCFHLSELNRSTIKSVNDNNLSVVFNPVYPGKLYNLSIWTESDKVSSLPTQLMHRVQPEPISQVHVIGITESSVRIAWNISQGEFRGFEIRYLDIVLETTDLSINITELNPYENYTFNIRTLSGSSSSLPTVSPPISISVQTLESFPGKVSDFHPFEVNAHNITFIWSLPLQDQHGVVTKFKLTSMLEKTNELFTRDIAPRKNKVTITALKPGRQYWFKIQAHTKVGYGPEAVWEQQMPPLSPPRPDDKIFPMVLVQTTSTIQIRFRKNFFSDDHGDILYYTIIVSEDLDDNSVILRMPSWRDVQSLNPWPPYQVLEPYQFFTNTSVVDFTIGQDSCVISVPYCNGPLKMGTTYKFKIRAFTRADLFSDTVYSHPVSTEDQYRILYALVFFVIFMSLVGLLILFRRDIRDKKSGDLILQNCGHSIPIAEFRTMCIDQHCLSKEFEELKLVGRSQTTLIAELPCNRPKNRFSNILPYDCSRYKLQSVDDEEGSDYINANYIAGHLSPRQYIATQGPLASTRDDFWRMCWESRTPAIVMLTQCVERGREKCHRYWPAGERALRCGEIDVHLLQVCHYTGWTVSHLRLSKGEEAMTIYHFHFTNWPDCGVPHSSQALVRFVLGFRARVPPGQNPIIVHCSAGVGRTGTFIAVDTIAQCLFNLKVTSSIDILGAVFQLRKHRMCMVQTEEQYFYIYDCVKLILLNDFSHIPETEVHCNDAFELDEGVDDL